MQTLDLATYLPLAQLAREIGVCSSTLKRRIESGEIQADALLRAGRRPPMALFAQGRLADIQQLIATEPETAL